MLVLMLYSVHITIIMQCCSFLKFYYVLLLQHKIHFKEVKTKPPINQNP